jgi:hypothetical protein
VLYGEPIAAIPLTEAVFVGVRTSTEDGLLLTFQQIFGFAGEK